MPMGHGTCDQGRLRRRPPPPWPALSAQNSPRSRVESGWGLHPAIAVTPTPPPGSQLGSKPDRNSRREWLGSPASNRRHGGPHLGGQTQCVFRLALCPTGASLVAGEPSQSRPEFLERLDAIGGFGAKAGQRHRGEGAVYVARERPPSRGPAGVHRRGRRLAVAAKASFSVSSATWA